jgi:hypothetical protein
MALGVTGSSDASFDALLALEATLGPKWFWHPNGIGQLPQAAQNAFVDRVLERSVIRANGIEDPGIYLRTIRDDREHFTPIKKLLMLERFWNDKIPPAIGGFLQKRPEELSRVWRESHALAWVSGWPLDAIDWREGAVLTVPNKSHAWLPDHLVLPHGDVVIESKAMVRLPKGLEVGRDLVIGRTKIRSLPGDLVVKRHLYAGQSGLEDIEPGGVVGGKAYIWGTDIAKWPEEKIRERLSVAGEIQR